MRTKQAAQEAKKVNAKIQQELDKIEDMGAEAYLESKVSGKTWGIMFAVVAVVSFLAGAYTF